MLDKAWWLEWCNYSGFLKHGRSDQSVAENSENLDDTESLGDLQVSAELESSKEADTSVIYSESQLSSTFNKVSTYSGSKSMRKKAHNMNQIKNFNELIVNSKKPGVISLTAEVRRKVEGMELVMQEAQVTELFQVINSEMWRAFRQWYQAKDELRLTLHKVPRKALPAHLERQQAEISQTPISNTQDTTKSPSNPQKHQSRPMSSEQTSRPSSQTNQAKLGQESKSPSLVKIKR